MQLSTNDRFGASHLNKHEIRKRICCPFGDNVFILLISIYSSPHKVFEVNLCDLEIVLAWILLNI